MWPLTCWVASDFPCIPCLWKLSTQFDRNTATEERITRHYIHFWLVAALEFHGGATIHQSHSSLEDTDCLWCTSLDHRPIGRLVYYRRLWSCMHRKARAEQTTFSKIPRNTQPSCFAWGEKSWTKNPRHSKFRDLHYNHIHLPRVCMYILISSGSYPCVLKSCRM